MSDIHQNYEEDAKRQDETDKALVCHRLVPLDMPIRLLMFFPRAVISKTRDLQTLACRRRTLKSSIADDSSSRARRVTASRCATARHRRSPASVATKQRSAIDGRSTVRMQLRPHETMTDLINASLQTMQRQLRRLLDQRLLLAASLPTGNRSYVEDQETNILRYAVANLDDLLEDELELLKVLETYAWRAFRRGGVWRECH